MLAAFALSGFDGRSDGRRRIPSPDSSRDVERRLSRLVEQVVLAVTKEHEVVVGHPPQERSRLVDLLVRNLGRRPVEAVCQLQHPALHRVPVTDRRRDLAEHALEVLGQVEQLPRIVHPRELGVQDRFWGSAGGVGTGVEHVHEPALLVAANPDHGMDDQIDRAARAGELHRHRVDDERHVVAHDLDHGWSPAERRARSVAGLIRVEHPNLGLVGRSHARELPVGYDRVIQIFLGAPGQIRGRNPVVELAHERLGHRGVWLG